jgi:hypothetical protein
VATVLCEKIEAIGAMAFRDDRDIGGGDDIPNEIFEAIASSDEVVVLLTPASVNRPWVLIEIGAALARGARMRVIALLEHVEIEPIPSMLKAKKVFSLNDFDRYLDELSARIQA